jgi:hypothetical protein
MANPQGRDGLIERFLWAYPESLAVPGWGERGIPDDAVEDWCVLVGRLWRRPMNLKDGRSVPHVAKMTAKGKAAWRSLYDAHAAEMNASHFPPALRGTWGKLREYAGRLTLILACMNHAGDPTADHMAVPDADVRAVEDAWRLVGYFKSHARRVHAAMAFGPGLGGGACVAAVLRWIVQERRGSFTERDVKQARRWMGDDELRKALVYLLQRNAIRAREPAPGPRGPGRPASPAYEVNPALLDPRNPQNARDQEGARLFEGSEDFESEEGEAA